MSSGRIAELAATIEVLTGAVHFLLAERVAAQPAEIRGDLLTILQRSLSAAPAHEADEGSPEPDELARWMPIAAATLIDGARRQLGREPEGVLSAAAGPQGSEVAEGCRCEYARAAAAKGEGGRAAA